jgi:hypothetical protein
MSRLLYTVLAIAMAALIAAPAANAAIGLNAISVTYTDAEGHPVTQAGAHPFAMTTTFALNTTAGPEGGIVPDEALKDLDIGLPAGFVGSQTAVPRCSTLDFLNLVLPPQVPACAEGTAVGTANVTIGQSIGTATLKVPVYNLEPSEGAAARLGFWIERVPVTLEVGVSQTAPYNLVALTRNVSQVLEFFGAEVTLWGNPADPAHDAERGKCIHEAGICPAGLAVEPFLSLPRACAGPVPLSYTLDSWQRPGIFTGQEVAPTPAITDCLSLSFDPSIAAGGTSSIGESPSGLDFDLALSDPGLIEPGGNAGSDIEKAVVVLPEGFTTNPAVAAGLGACTLAQYEAESLRFEPATGCPQSAKVGSVEVASPLLEEQVEGQIYVAKQGENVFHSLLALYMILRNEKNGILIKQPMRIDPDPQTGRLTSTVTEIPQLPFSDFHLHFRTGPRAPLITPALCGRYPVAAQVFPYSDPSAPVTRMASLEVSSGASGVCASSPGQLPNNPNFSAGTINPTGGAYSPFVLKLSRADGSQQFSSVSTTLPDGLLGKLAGIPYCSDAQIAAAGARGGEGEGAVELARPSCSAASEVGSVIVASGAGSEPLYVTGHAYLAGPYRGASLSLEIITPAIAGPFDLGTVAIRTALQVNPETAEITAVSDPIPTILHGLPLDIRSIAIDMNRPNFTLNPTSCAPKAIVGSVTSTVGATAAVSEYFQAANCRALKFKPKLQLSLKGSTKRTGHPALKAVLTYPKGGAYANIARAQVNLPHSEFIEQNNLNKTCTKPVLLEGKCPKSTIYGTAKAWTPLLDKPLQGDVYLVGGFGYKLPAMVAELNGQIRVLLKGKVDSGPNGGIRNTFEAVPDAPVEKFVLELKGGPKYSLLINSENLCKKPQKAIARFTAQNGKVLQTKPVIANSCKKKSKGGGKKKSGSSAKKHGK